jgi:hypothetical protein
MTVRSPSSMEGAMRRSDGVGLILRSLVAHQSKFLNIMNGERVCVRSLTNLR